MVNISMHYAQKIAALSTVLLLASCGHDNTTHVNANDSNLEKKRPNILLIVGDDLGYAEMGAYGGEIKTPTLDALAKKGTKFTDFNVAPTCSPTRSMLLSGVDNHVAGLGSMGEIIAAAETKAAPLPPKLKALSKLQLGQPGYEGHLNKHVHSFPQILKDNGYNTYMAGKWHLGTKPEQRPYARGFNHTFSMLEGAASHFSDGWRSIAPKAQAQYSEDGVLVNTLTKDFYSSTAYVNKMIGWLEKDLAENSEQPFFSYLAFTAVHDPIHVPEADIDLYKNKYNDGYEILAEKRLRNMKTLGLVEQHVKRPARLPYSKPWDSLTAEEKLRSARQMETYAAMLEVMDRELGRLIAFLDKAGELDNTVVIFMSDNGASPSNHKFYGFKNTDFNNRLENIGRLGSFQSYNMGWAQAGTVPFNYFKTTTAEGGIRAPLIITGPNLNTKSVSNAFMHVTDLAPTILDIAGVKPPKDKTLKEMTGQSYYPLLKGKVETVRADSDVIGTELFGNKSLRAGNFKITSIAPPYGKGKWALFNVANDPAEQNDLSLTEPDKFNTLLAKWDDYVKKNNVIMLEE